MRGPWPPFFAVSLRLGGKERKTTIIERNQFTEETKASKLAKFLSGIDLCYIDTCSLMEESFGPFLDTLNLSTEYFEDHRPEFIVVGQVVNELEKHAKKGETLELRIDAKRALRFLKLDKKGNKLFTIEKVRSTEDFADPAIYSSISAQRINKKIILISQDKQLADDVRSLNNLDSQHGKFVNVYKVDPYGELLENKGNVYQNQIRAQARTSRNLPSKIPEKNLREAQPLPRPAAKKEAPKSIVPLDIKNLDRAISSNIRNSTYPLARKLDDLDRQLKNLGSYSSSDISSWNLLYGPDALLKAKGELIALQEKTLEEKEVPAVKEAKPAPQPVAPAPEPRPAAKPAPEAPKKRSPFGKGDTFISALKDLLGRYGTMIRDDGVPYVAGVHGPYDLVSSDFSKLVHEVAMLEIGSKKDATVKNLVFHIEKNQGDYRVTLEEAPKAEPAKAPAPAKKEPAPKKETAPAKKPAAKKSQPAAPKAQEAAEASAPKSGPKPHPGRKAIHSPSYEEALKADRDLKAKINNPTYPLESKIKDLQAQEALVRTLKQSELKDLNYTVRGLQKAVRDLKATSK